MSGVVAFVTNLPLMPSHDREFSWVSSCCFCPLVLQKVLVAKMHWEHVLHWSNYIFKNMRKHQSCGIYAWRIQNYVFYFCCCLIIIRLDCFNNRSWSASISAVIFIRLRFLDFLEGGLVCAWFLFEVTSSSCACRVICWKSSALSISKAFTIFESSPFNESHLVKEAATFCM